MPGENFSRRVARAASVGGGRGYRRQTPLSWYAIVFLICVVGIALIAYSRYEVSHPATATAKAKNNTPPTAQNLWKVGLELDICGKMQKLPASTTPGPFTTDGSGVVTIAPGLASHAGSASGSHATLNAFLVPAGISLTTTNLTITPPVRPSTTTTTTAPAKSSTSTSPASSTTSTSTTTTTLAPARSYSNGQRCEGGKGVVQTEVWASPSAKSGKIYTRNATAIRFKNGQLFTIAFVPKGASIPKPSSAGAIAQYLIANPAGLSTGTTGSTLPASSVPSSTGTTGSTLPASSVPATSPASSTTSTSTTTKSSSGG